MRSTLVKICGHNQSNKISGPVRPFPICWRLKKTMTVMPPVSHPPLLFRCLKLAHLYYQVCAHSKGRINNNQSSTLIQICGHNLTVKPQDLRVTSFPYCCKGKPMSGDLTHDGKAPNFASSISNLLLSILKFVCTSRGILNSGVSTLIHNFGQNQSTKTSGPVRPFPFCCKVKQP